MLGAGSLTLLSTRPPGVKEVTNALPAKAPRTPRAGTRPVSTRPDGRHPRPHRVARRLRGFRRAFTGIGKARATQLWRGERRIIHVTVAGPLGATIPEKTLENLAAALERARDPGIVVQIEPVARILVRFAPTCSSTGGSSQPTIERMRATLVASFDFDRRGFGEPLTTSQAISVVMPVPGLRDARPRPPSHQRRPASLPSRFRTRSSPGSRAGPATPTRSLQQSALLEPAGATVTERGS